MSAAMLATYQSILARPGAARFSLTGLVARLPISMVGLGIVLLVEGRTGSYAVAGTVSAAALIANAVCAVPQGRLIDRFGQGRVLGAAITTWGVALALMMVSVEAGWPRGTTYVLAAVSGAALPSVGTCVRARWSALLPDPEERATAFALEAVFDEVVFMLGPIVVTLLATAVDPVAGLATAVVVGLAGTWAFAGQRGTQPTPHRHDHATGPRPPMPWATIVPLTVTSAALGLLFGAAEVTTVAFADEQGHKAASGLLLATWALGSLVAGAVTGAVRWRRGPAVRLRVGAGALTVFMALLALVGSVPVMAAALLVGGFAIAPTLIATTSLTERSLPATRLTEGMAFVQTGIVAGVAPGASVAGLVIDAHGASAAYLVCAAAGLLALLGGVVTPEAPLPR